MNTINQTIPAAFGPDTAFVIAPQPVNDGHERERETFVPLRLLAASENEFTRRGIPHSALHD
jgi:hypothetical protein